MVVKSLAKLDEALEQKKQYPEEWVEVVEGVTNPNLPSPEGQDTPLIHQSHFVIVIIDTDPELGTV